MDGADVTRLWPVTVSQCAGHLFPPPDLEPPTAHSSAFRKVERKDFEALLQAASDGKIDVIIARDQDRLLRHQRVVGRFSDCTDYDLDIITADVRADMAYLVCWERAKLRMDGQPTTIALRVTNIYRREDGQWKNTHRHADPATDDPGQKILGPGRATVLSVTARQAAG